jgi:hypothetical protein
MYVHPIGLFNRKEQGAEYRWRCPGTYSTTYRATELRTPLGLSFFEAFNPWRIGMHELRRLSWCVTEGKTEAEMKAMRFDIGPDGIATFLKEFANMMSACGGESGAPSDLVDYTTVHL